MEFLFPEKHFKQIKWISCNHTLEEIKPKSAIHQSAYLTYFAFRSKSYIFDRQLISSSTNGLGSIAKSKTGIEACVWKKQLARHQSPLLDFLYAWLPVPPPPSPTVRNTLIGWLFFYRWLPVIAFPGHHSKLERWMCPFFSFFFSLIPTWNLSSESRGGPVAFAVPKHLNENISSYPWGDKHSHFKTWISAESFTMAIGVSGLCLFWLGPDPQSKKFKLHHVF